MFPKSILAELIDNAVENCYIHGEGRQEDDWDLGLLVTAEWTECSDPEYGCIIHICIFKNNVPVLAYDDPETKCN